MSNLTQIYELATLSNGDELLVHAAYTAKQSAGVTVLVVVSCISLVAIMALLSSFVISAFYARHSNDQPLFVRSHIGAYFISLLACDSLRAIGSIMSAHWLRKNGVEAGAFCTTQGVILQISDVGTALWTVVITLHTFNYLFLRWKGSNIVLYASLIAGWSFIGAMVLVGPAALNTRVRGPFFGIAGYWCWIAQEYVPQRFTLGYLFMFVSAFISLICSLIVFLRLRGNLLLSGLRVHIVFASAGDVKDWADPGLAPVAKRILLYPVTYTILIVPMATVRFLEWAGRQVAPEGTIFCATVLLLSGFVNVLLFLSIQPHLSATSLSAPKQDDTDSSFTMINTIEAGLGVNGTQVREGIHQTSQPELTKPAPMLKRSDSYESVTEMPVLRQSLSPSTHKLPPRDVPSDIEIPRRGSMESMYTDREPLSSLDEIQLSGRTIPESYYNSPPWSAGLNSSRRYTVWTVPRSAHS
jgi:hypothetical protein